MSGEDAIKLEGAKLITFSPKAASGDESAKLAFAFAVEVDTVAAYMNRITRLYRKRRSITIGFAGINVKGAELVTFSPKAAKVTKDGDETEPPKMALGFRADLDAVEDKLTRISQTYREGRAASLSLEAIEQLELPKAQPTLTDAVNGNGHGKADALKDTKVVDLKGKAKTKGKAKQHVPI